MSTTLPEPVLQEAEPLPPAPHDPLEGALEDRLPEWFRTPRSVVGFALVIGLVFLAFNYFPIWHTDIWGHLAYGRLLWNTRALPASEPLMPLSTGMPIVDSAWLSQVLGYGLVSRFGAAAIRFLWAGSIALCCGLLLWTTRRRTGSVFWPLVGVVVFLWVSWQQFVVVRPQLGGLVCFVALFGLLSARRFPRPGWIAVPALMTLWTNLHGSFPVGIAVLGAFLVGRAADVIRRSDRFLAVFRDPAVRRYFLLLELAFAATLLNPYGLALWADMLAFAKNPNLQDLLDWEPLTLRMRQGQAAAATALLLAVLYRITPRRISVTEVLLHLGLGGGALWMNRMLIWWAPVAAYWVAMHGHAAYQKASASRWMEEPVERRSLWTVAAIGVLLICFTITPSGRAALAALKGKNVPAAGNLSAATPIGAVDYLRKNPPQGLVFNAEELGDYLLWAGPPGMKLFVNSHVHLVPVEVWQHYLEIVGVSASWKDLLDVYGINTVVLDTPGRRALIRTLKRDEDWRVGYEDRNTVVLLRRNPL